MFPPRMTIKNSRFIARRRWMLLASQTIYEPYQGHGWMSYFYVTLQLHLSSWEPLRYIISQSTWL
jgi:hypothetical protein